jgi:N-acetylmuramoyl-L-alanine amidase
MSIRTHIDKAGRFPVRQIQCPHFSTPIDLSAPRAGVLHTTEGGWAGSLDVFKIHYAPHFVVGQNAVDNKVEIAQLVAVGTIGAAIVTHNSLAIVQIEMIGYSKEALWLPDDETLDALASLMLVCRDEWDIPLTHPWPDGDFGRAGKNPHRASGKFGKIAGWYGHGDCPSPDTHWDPGALEWTKIFERAKVLDTIPAEGAS